MKVSLAFIAVVLTAVFVTLKLTAVITWSWWIVFLPLLIWAGILALLGIGILLLILMAAKYGN